MILVSALIQTPESAIFVQEAGKLPI